MRGFQFVAMSLLAASTALGCGSAPESEETGKVTQWLGDKSHFAVSGTFDGKPMNIRLEGDAAQSVRCTRNYAALPGAVRDAQGNYDTSQLYFVMKEIGVVTNIDGKPTEVSVGYWRHDAAAGSTLEVIPREKGTSIPAGKTWVDFELGEPGVDGVNGIEKAAERGTLQMKLNSGMPDQNGIFIPTGGRTGDFISIDWGPQESLTISMTSDCQDSLVVPWGRSVAPP